MIEEKHRNPATRFKKVPVIMTTNKLPSVMREPKPKPGEDEDDFKARYDNFMAFRTRCKIHRMQVSHRNQEKFPYTKDDLAIYMDDIMDKMSPIQKDKPVDEVVSEEDSLGRDIRLQKDNQDIARFKAR